ncbi:prolow-density lipoprotein receptor-related protein 1-like [Danio aesculapii]|uniref:prolow-density lipoprotein receptor-related protein 1-like n=1 Tax=Danio aesculapii TaxID=1142201 RepID=UPI0024BFCB38|nr:prolow-density lipoprotein receptor-related protein 1-like [Danio aesculapii]
MAVGIGDRTCQLEVDSCLQDYSQGSDGCGKPGNVKESLKLASKCSIMDCQYNCSVTMSGPKCYCKNGYEVGEDGKTCKDFNECAVYGTCSQMCTNSEGSYTCSCVEGYLPQLDNRSCKAKNDPVDRLPFLLIANSQNIQATSLSGANPITINDKQTTTMDFIYAQETVCWIHMGDSPTASQLKCAKFPNAKSFTEEKTINISLSLHRKSTFISVCFISVSALHLGWKMIQRNIFRRL